MDVAREGVAENRRRRRLVFGALAGAGFVALALFALRLQPAAPSVDRETVFIDTVRRGEMLLTVRGPGTLVPIEVRRIAAGSSGRVARVHALPGVRVESDTVILTLENQSLAQELTGAELELAAAEANLDDRRVQLRRQVLNQRSLLASVEAEARQAALDAEADAEIHAEGIIGRITLGGQSRRRRGTRDPSSARSRTTSARRSGGCCGARGRRGGRRRDSAPFSS